jgi:hypothetical protein
MIVAGILIEMAIRNCRKWGVREVKTATFQDSKKQ